MKLKMITIFKPIRTDSGGRQKGSISLEASFAFPAFFFCIMLLYQLFLLIMTECFVAKAICNLTTDMAPISYAERALLKENVTAPSLLYYPEALATIGKNSRIDNLRIICLDDESENVEVGIYYDFLVEAPGFPVFTLGIKQCFLLHPFIGEYDKDRLEQEEEEETDRVYITEGGQVYHLKRTCSYLFMPVEGVKAEDIKNRRNSSGAKYYPCERCSNSRQTEKVYITAYGNRYHLSTRCSSLFRDVKEVSIDEVSDRRPCSKCGQEQ